MCYFCDINHEEYDSSNGILENEMRLEISNWDDYYGTYGYVSLQVNYCPICGNQINKELNTESFLNESKEEGEKENLSITKYIYDCGVDKFTGTYETSIDAVYHGQTCIILNDEDFSYTWVRFEDGFETSVYSEYLKKISY